MTQSQSGDQVEVWVNLVLRRAASMWPFKGDERFANAEKVAYEQIEFRVRYSSDIANLNPLDRVIHPALTTEEASDPNHVIPTRAIHNVLAVFEIGRREGFRIITERRADVSA